MGICVCSTSLTNTGTPGCAPLMDQAYGFLFTRLYDGGGVANKIDASTTLNKAFFDALINNADKTKRLFPFMPLQNVEDTRADTVFEEFANGSKREVRQGIRSVNAMFVGADASYLAKLAGFKCVKGLGAYAVDVNGSLIGDSSEAGFLKPIPLESKTFDPKFIKGTDTTSSKVQVMFDWLNSFFDESLGMLTVSDFAADVNLKSVEGLLDLYGKPATAISTTAFTMEIYSKFGSVNGNAVSDLTATELEVYNETTAALVSLDSITENPVLDGSYTFDFSGSAQTPADILHVRIISAVLGFDDTVLRTVNVTIP
jgi:hypothetical protein